MDIPLNDGQSRTAWYLVYDLKTLLTQQDKPNLVASAKYGSEQRGELLLKKLALLTSERPDSWEYNTMRLDAGTSAR